jgi:hypothetical protein
MNSKPTFHFKSTEWGISIYLVILGVLAIAAIPTFIQFIAPKSQHILIQNITLIAIIIVLSLSYKKLFVSEVIIFQDEHQNIIIQWKKIGGKKERMIAPDSLKTIGVGKTKGTSGVFLTPEKHWIHLEGMGRKYFFYEEVSPSQSQKLMSFLKKNYTGFRFSENIFG